MRAINECKLLDVQCISNTDGSLAVIEGDVQIPFSIKRLFYIFNVNSSAVRGMHANMQSNFAMVCLAGSCKVKLYDGLNESVILLKEPNRALFIPNMIWKEMYEFTDNCVLLVISDCPYNPNEYIRNKDTYAEKNREKE